MFFQIAKKVLQSVIENSLGRFIDFILFIGFVMYTLCVDLLV